jgi:lysyl-tRNA synthetase class 2
MVAPAWCPRAGPVALARRAEVLARIRAFFAARGVMEVETPLLAPTGTTDPAIESLRVPLLAPGAATPREYYLQTSPEFAMKRLLVAGSGPIYQICKSFRAGEAGRRHNPEFTLLEWYRPGFDHWRLMDEVEALVRQVLPDLSAIVRRPYGEAFLQATGLDPHRAPTGQLRAYGQGIPGAAGCLPPAGAAGERAFLLDLLFGLRLAPTLGGEAPTFLFDFPVEHAALARTRRLPAVAAGEVPAGMAAEAVGAEAGEADTGEEPPGEVPAGEVVVAERFELFIGGMEIANGFHELCDAAEQRARFHRDLALRAARGQAPVPVDESFLAALAVGLPPCAGVAVGVDRLLMLALASADIGETLAFPLTRA